MKCSANEKGIYLIEYATERACLSRRHDDKRGRERLPRDGLNEDEFRDRYLLIVFAVINDHNAKGRNLEAFRKTFGSPTKTNL